MSEREGTSVLWWRRYRHKAAARCCNAAERGCTAEGARPEGLKKEEE